jgi:hypothetical protein
MRFEIFMKVENNKLLILDKLTNYIKPIFDIDSKKTA